MTVSETSWQETIDALYRQADGFLQVRYNIEHTRIAHRMAKLLMEREGGDRRIVEPAIILHDVGWSTLEPDQIDKAYGPKAKGEEARRLNRLHETNGARMAGEILSGMGYDDKLKEIIVAIIERHDSGQSVDSLEEAIVKDADKLWRYTKVCFDRIMKRLGLSLAEVIAIREKGLAGWFFTDSAPELAREELERTLAAFKGEG